MRDRDTNKYPEEGGGGREENSYHRTSAPEWCEKLPLVDSIKISLEPHRSRQALFFRPDFHDTFVYKTSVITIGHILLSVRLEGGSS